MRNTKLAMLSVCALVAACTAINAQDIKNKVFGSIITIKGSEGDGSGFIANFNDKKVIITNAHVACRNQKVAFYDSNNGVVKVKGMYIAKDRDIAIYTLAEPDSYPALDVATEVHNIKFNIPIVVYGNSLGAAVNTELKGILKGVGPKAIEITSQIVPGNSGSAVIDMNSGKVIGVATFAILQPKNWTTEGTRFSQVRRFGTRIDNLDVKTLQKVNSKKYSSDMNLYRRLVHANDISIAALTDICEKQEATGAIGMFMKPNSYKGDPGMKKIAQDWNVAVKNALRTGNFNRTFEDLLNRMKSRHAAAAKACQRNQIHYAYVREMIKEEFEKSKLVNQGFVYIHGQLKMIREQVQNQRKQQQTAPGHLMR